jgi:ubiquinone/menaquinone biosynthesis C-methylase UbiE
VTEFNDHFSQGAADYSAFRPAYPDALFDWLSAHTVGHVLAWDCATGNGQAARGLAQHYEQVIGTDASAGQLAHALPHPRIQYRVAAAEHSGLADGTADIVTVAQALHWLPLAPFFEEVQRVLAPGGLVAVWGYGLPRASSAELDRELERFHDIIVGPYWPPERKMVEEEYRGVPFPFVEIAVPPFAIEQLMTRAGLEGYLRTWSATQRYRAARPDDDPVNQIAQVLGAEWPDPEEVRLVRWPMFVRAGRRRDARDKNWTARGTFVRTPSLTTTKTVVDNPA